MTQTAGFMATNFQWPNKWPPRDQLAQFEWVKSLSQSLPASTSIDESRRPLKCKRQPRRNAKRQVDKLLTCRYFASA